MSLWPTIWNGAMQIILVHDSVAAYLHYVILYLNKGKMFCGVMLRVCVMYIHCLALNCFVFFGVYCGKHWNTWNYLKIKFKFIKIQKISVLEILSAFLWSQLSAGVIASGYNKSEDALILTVPAKHSDFWKCLLVNAAVYYSVNSFLKKKNQNEQYKNH